uniref:non-specific serine/threonine protein kinase n=1 Tax=Fagus sylvatica TaxID=28930 RepID=A0A2N9FY46_FAGSY
MKGDASINSDGPINSSVGRAIYNERVHLWDNNTGRLTDFTTHFSFIIKAVNKNSADGLAFFIAPFGSNIPVDLAGGYLGLFSRGSAINDTENKIVAVEFDTFRNDWDPSDNHVGIDVNSLVSKANVTWNISFNNGSRANAWISYNSTTKNLSVFLTFADNPVFSGNSILSFIVNLKTILPEWVSVGFSAATGVKTELHTLLSWSFSSSLEAGNTPPNNIGDGDQKNKMGVGRNTEDFGDDGSIEDEFEKGTGPRKFTYRELLVQQTNLLKKGSLGREDSEAFTKPVRYKIAQGLASALLYLHEEWEQCVVHRDIKSSNIMLDSNFNAKLGDFGLARLVEHEFSSQTTILAGTMGYLALECFTTGKASKKSDVYSFGVVSLEIACGRKPIEPQTEPSKVRLVEWVWDLYGKGQLLEAIDKGLTA